MTGTKAFPTRHATGVGPGRMSGSMLRLRHSEPVAGLKLVKRGEHQQGYFQGPLAGCSGARVEHFAVADERDGELAVEIDVPGHQAPPMTSRRRVRPSITAAEVRISAVRLASCSMRPAACRRSAAWWGCSFIRTESARARKRFASPRISSGLN